MALVRMCIQTLSSWPRGVGWGGWEGGSRGRGYGDICMDVADALCCTTETNTTLWSNYTPIKTYKNKNKHCQAWKSSTEWHLDNGIFL